MKGNSTSAKPGNRFHPALMAVLAGLTAITSGMALAQTGAGTKEQSLLPVVFFYSPTCHECQKAHESIDAVERKYAGKICVERHSVASAEGMELMFAYEEKCGADDGAPPKVFVGKRSLGGAPIIIAQLDGVIRDELASRQSQAATPATRPAATTEPAVAIEAAPATEPATITKPAPAADLAIVSYDPLSPPAPQRVSYVVSPGREDILGSDSMPPVAAIPMPAPLAAASEDPVPGGRLARRFQSFQVGAIMMAGLVDGVNPCAFTTVVFLLSAVAYLGKTKRQIAIVGIAFTFAVFGTYLLLGLGLMLAIKTFAMQAGISRTVTYVIAGTTFVLAGWSLFDGIRIAHTGKIPKGTLGLPGFLKVTIRRVITAGLKTRNLVM